MKGVSIVAVWLLGACGASDGEALTCTNEASAGPLGPYGIVVHGGDVYWTVSDTGSVWRAPIAGGDPTMFAELGGYPRAMVAGSDAFYVAGGCEGTVWRIPFDSAAPDLRAVVSGDSCIHGIAVDADHVFFTNGGVNELAIGGGVPHGLVPVPADGYGCLGAITIAGDHLYWISPCSSVTSEFAAVSAMPIAGGPAVAIDSGQTDSDAIAADATHVYWAANGSISRIALTGGPIERIAPTGSVVSGIAVDATSVYWTTNSALWKAPLAGGPPTIITSIDASAGVTVDATNVYWGGGGVCPAQHVPK